MPQTAILTLLCIRLVDRQCKLSILTDGSTDIYSRYQFWTGAVALTGVCVRGGQMGVRHGLGKSLLYTMCGVSKQERSG